MRCITDYGWLDWEKRKFHSSQWNLMKGRPKTRREIVALETRRLTRISQYKNILQKRTHIWVKKSRSTKQSDNGRDWRLRQAEWLEDYKGVDCLISMKNSVGLSKIVSKKECICQCWASEEMERCGRILIFWLEHKQWHWEWTDED
jgi:hypothetical protein